MVQLCLNLMVLALSWMLYIWEKDGGSIVEQCLHSLLPFCLLTAHTLVLHLPLQLGLGTEFRSEKIPRNRIGTISVIPRKEVLIPRHSEFRGRVNSEARNGMERNGIPQKY
jgi:hypothetical protein